VFFFSKLLDFASGGFNGNETSDPWNSNVNNNNLTHQLNDPWSTKNNKNTLIDDGIWLDNSKSKTNTNPWSTANTNNNNNCHQDQLKLNDPWSTSSSSSTPITELKQSVNLLDDFDVFTTNRIQSPTANANKKLSNSVDPLDDFFGGSVSGGSSSSVLKTSSTNPWSNPTAPSAQSSSMMPALSNIQVKSTSVGQPTRNTKTPESFLGENSSLVNLDNLIPATTTTTNQRPKSTNPFGSSSASGTAGGGLMPSLSGSSLLPQQQQQRPPSVNPFQAQVQKGPTINQLTYQQQQQNNLFAGFSAPNQMPQLSQPLIPPTNNISTQPMFTSSQSNFQTNQSTNPFLMM
jgi:epsin